MAKRPQPESENPAPKAPKKPGRFLNRLVAGVVLLALLGGVAWWRLQQESKGPALAKGEPLVENMAEEGEVAAIGRTDPEVGEIMPSTIIQTETTGETSITVLTPPAEEPTPDIVDVTAKITAPPPPAPAPTTRDVAAAGFAQATLKLAQNTQNQQLRAVALYTAYVTASPEMADLLAAVQTQAETPRQKQTLSQLAEATRQYGPVRLADILAKLKAKPNQATVAPEERPEQLPNWWEETAGRFISVRKVTPVGEQEIPSATVVTLPQALKRGDWARVDALLAQAPYNGADHAPARALIQAYRAQHQALGQLLQEVFSE